MFAQGDAAIPALGMNQIPIQLAQDLPDDSILFEQRVEKLSDDRVILADGMEIKAETIVLATPEYETARLLGHQASRDIAQEYCLYFSADEAPVSEPFLTLNGEGRGLLNSVTFPSLVSPDYAPADKVLVAAVVPGYHGLTLPEVETAVKKELTNWFGSQVEAWRSLRSYHVHNALPIPSVPSKNPLTFNPRVDRNVFTCSELGSLPSIQWALFSGNRAAKAVSNYLDALSPVFC
jgi:protoporphyrinogen oxidase